MKKYRINMKRFYMTLLTGLCILACCSAVAANGRRVEKVTVRAGSRNVTKKIYQMEQGKNISLRVSVFPGSAAAGISYRSSKKDVASVSKNGKVTAKKWGLQELQFLLQERMIRK